MTTSAMTNFNSSKVRLELTSCGRVSSMSTISIPVRYDWNYMVFCVPRHMFLHFNSSKVRLELKMRCRIIFALYYFNSSKVRLELFVPYDALLPNNISIPVRYDWNYFARNADARQNSISIPVRYDWNTRRENATFVVYLFQFQ